MPTFRIYNVVNEDNKVVKIGSTFHTLEHRSKGTIYRGKKYKNCKLILRREFEEADSLWGDTLRYVREQFEIARAHTWFNEGGWNIREPVYDFIYSCTNHDAAVAGGKIAARVNKESGKDVELGKRAGAANVESGHIYRLGKEWGKKTGIRNCTRWANSEGNKRRLAAVRTPEHQRDAATQAAKIAVETGQIQKLGMRMKTEKKGIFSPEYSRSETAKKQHEKLTAEQKSEHARNMNRFKTPEMRRKAAYAGHHRKVHIPQNVNNPKC